MDRNPSLIDETATGGDQNLSQRAVCPGCQTAQPSLTREGLVAGIAWKCARCGQRWDAGRLAAVAAYETWVAEREAPATTGAALQDGTATARLLSVVLHD